LLNQQWKEFIVKPAMTFSGAMTGPIVIIIDAVDESGNADSRSHLLQALAGTLEDSETKITNLPSNFRIILISRPLKDIVDALMGVEHIKAKSMDAITISSTLSDIYYYLSHKLSGLTFSDANNSISSLSKASGGLFEWARLASEYIRGADDIGSTSEQQFQDLMASNKEERIDLLDQMYKFILEQLFLPGMRGQRSSRLEIFKSVMAQMLGTLEPLSLSGLDSMRQNFPEEKLRKIDVTTIIKPLGALLSGTTDPSAVIHPLHASFPEFLTEEKRSGEFFVDVSTIDTSLVTASLLIMKHELRYNICQLPSSYLQNSEVVDLEERIKKYISPQLSYSCRFWTYHLEKTSLQIDLVEMICVFLHEDQILFWFEILSLLKRINTCSSCLATIIKWVQVSRILYIYYFKY